MGDFNAHNILWGSDHTDPRGKLLEHIIVSHDLNIINNNQPTHFNCHNGTTSIIDLAICSPRISTIFDFETIPDLSGSDHYPIAIKILMNTRSKQTKRPRWIIERADWIKFGNLIKFKPEYLQSSVDEMCNHITSSIISAAKSSIPKTSQNIRRNHVPWWNLEIAKSIKNRKKALKSFSINPTQENLCEFRKLKAIARKIVRKAKKESWEQFTTSINSNTSSSTVWSSIGKICGKAKSTTIETLNINNDLLTSPIDIANALGHQFSKMSNSCNYSSEFLKHKQITENTLNICKDNNNKPINIPFSKIELDHALTSCKGSTPGPDDIHYSMIKNITYNEKLYILKFYNHTISGIKMSSQKVGNTL